MVRRIEFEKVSNLPVLSDGFSLVARSISSMGAGLFLFVEGPAREQLMEKFEQGTSVFPARLYERKRFVLLAMVGGKSQAFELGTFDLTFPIVDVFPDGRVLVADSLSQWRGPNDYDKNGILIDPSTGEQSRILLGDGIESLSVDSLGRIWVSYSDVGVFGGLGWGRPGPEPVGAYGLNCFSVSGKLLWSFPGDITFGSISHCYAMNVHGRTASVYFYTKFPLCRVASDFRMTYWETELAGCSHFAIDDSSVLFSGQYDEAPAIGHLALLGDGRLQERQEVEFRLPDKSPISSGQLLGRGAAMHYFDDSGWYRTRLVDGDC